MTAAHWYGDTLFIAWHGGNPEEAAYWRRGRLLFDGVSETFNRKYAEKPEAGQALRDILNWQCS